NQPAEAARSLFRARHALSQLSGLVVIKEVEAQIDQVRIRSYIVLLRLLDKVRMGAAGHRQKQPRFFAVLPENRPGHFRQMAIIPEPVVIGNIAVFATEKPAPVLSPGEQLAEIDHADPGP